MTPTGWVEAHMRQPISKNRIHAIAWAIVISTTVLPACRSKLKVISKPVTNGGAEVPPSETEDPPQDGGQTTGDIPPIVEDQPKATPLEVSGLLSAQRLYYQSRSVISLNISSDGISTNSRFSLFNDTTHETLIENQSLDYGLTDDGNISDYFMVAEAPYDIFIRLYPSASGSRGRFGYGANKLRLLFDDEVKPTFSQSTIYLSDFQFFAFSGISFLTNLQSQQGLQGAIEAWNSPIGTNGVGSLVTGTIPLLNH